MKWFSTLKRSKNIETSVTDAVKDLKSHLRVKQADLGLLFVSFKHREELIDLWPVLHKEIPCKTLIGCTGGGVIGGGHEAEGEAAVSLTAAVLPKVKIASFHFHQEHLPSPDASPQRWRELLHADAQEKPHFILLSDPFSIDAHAMLEGFDYAFPESKKVGGLSSGGVAPDENLLFINDRLLHRGTVGVTLSGNIDIEVVVAQGCRPIGKPMTVTESQGNVLLRVDQERPLAILQKLYEKLSSRDRKLLQQSLFLGISMDSFKTNLKQGDFLIRNIVGVDEQEGVLAVGAELRVGQTVQFHLRDAVTSHEDLKLMLSKSKTSQMKDTAGIGAVLFSCLGRGKQLYGEAHHDSTLFKSVVGDVPVGGFFCNGEIGPVGGKTYLHGYTSSIAVFQPGELSK